MGFTLIDGVLPGETGCEVLPGWPMYHLYVRLLPLAETARAALSPERIGTDGPEKKLMAGGAQTVMVAPVLFAD